MRRGELGRPFQFWPEITSTSDVLKDWARGGAPHGAVVAADYQRQGRGRRGRMWVAGPGEAVLASVLLRRDLGPVERLGLWSLVWAVAVAEAVETAIGMPIGVKWPNDVEVDGRKVAGILAEASLRQGVCEFLVVGIGVNVLQERFAEDVRDSRTSLRLLSGRSVDRGALLAEILWRGERWANRLQDREGTAALQEAFTGRFRAWLGREVVVRAGEEALQGRVAGVDPHGFLLLDTARGRRALPVGEFTLRLQAGPAEDAKAERGEEGRR